MKKFSKVSILVCTHVHMGLHNKSCGGCASLELFEKLKKQIVEQDLDISVREQACFGRCEEAVVARIYPNKEYFIQLTDSSLSELVDIAKKCLETKD